MKRQVQYRFSDSGGAFPIRYTLGGHLLSWCVYSSTVVNRVAADASAVVISSAVPDQTAVSGLSLQALSIPQHLHALDEGATLECASPKSRLSCILAG